MSDPVPHHATESVLQAGDTWPEGLPTLGQVLDEKRRQLKALREIAVALGTSMELDTLLRLVMRHVTDLLDADRSTLYLIDSQRGDMWSKVMQGEDWREIHLRIGQGLAGWVALHGEALRVVDATQDPRFNPRVDAQTGYQTLSVLALPVRNQRGETLGVVQVLNKRSEQGFTEDDEALLTVLAKQMAVAIDNSALLADALQRNHALQRAQEALARRVDEQDLMFELQQAMAQSSSLQELLGRALARTISIVGAAAGAIILRQNEGEGLYFHSALGGASQSLKRMPLAPGQGIAGWVVQHNRPVLLDRADLDPRHDPSISARLNYPIKALICAPLDDGQGGEASGAIELINNAEGGTFLEHDLRLVQLIAGQIAIGLRVIAERESLERRQRLESIGQMLASIVHDFKTPMTAISGYAELMAITDEPEERNAQSEIIVDHVTRLRDMVHELLQFARGQTEVLLRRVDLDDFAKVLRTSMIEAFSGSSSHFTLQQHGQGPVYIDQGKMLRVVGNLARNAIEAMQAQGGGAFSITLRHQAPDLELLCTDTGPGIPEVMNDRLFESFASHGKKDGTGLGLAIVKKIVDEHRGHLTWSSSAQGAQFKIQIPLRQQSSRPSPPQGARA